MCHRLVEGQVEPSCTVVRVIPCTMFGLRGAFGGRNPANTVGKATCLVCSCVSPKGHILKTGSSSRIPVSNSQRVSFYESLSLKKMFLIFPFCIPSLSVFFFSLSEHFPRCLLGN